MVGQFGRMFVYITWSRLLKCREFHEIADQTSQNHFLGAIRMSRHSRVHVHTYIHTYTYRHFLLFSCCCKYEAPKFVSHPRVIPPLLSLTSRRLPAKTSRPATARALRLCLSEPSRSPTTRRRRRCAKSRRLGPRGQGLRRHGGVWSRWWFLSAPLARPRGP